MVKIDITKESWKRLRLYRDGKDCTSFSEAITKLLDTAETLIPEKKPEVINNG